jgi:hypothetical protein
VVSVTKSVLPALLLAALLPTVTSVTGATGAAADRGAAADETTTSQNNLRTGWDPDEPELTPANVSGRTPGYAFGQVFQTAVTGQVYAQPLVIGSTVIVATEQDYVYGLNASTGAVQWQTSLGTPYQIPNCTDLAPDIGVTGGPVYDPATGDVYLVAQTVPKTAPSYHLFGINPATGAVVLRQFLGGRPSNDPDITLNAADQLERPGLLLLNGWVYAAFGSHCDHSPWTGFVDGVNVSTKATTEWGDETGVTDNEAGIWQGGGGLMSDGSGRIIVSTGNGVSPPPGPGDRPPGQLGDSVVRLAVNGNGTLAAKDFFSPVNAPALDAGDTDYGSGGPAGLPFGTSQYPHVLAQAGKDGRIFLLNRDGLGGREQGRRGGDDALSVTQPYNGQWGHPAAFGGTPTLTAANQAHASDYLYYIGRNDSLRMLKAGVNKSDEPRLADVASSSVTFGFSSGSPVVTSTGPHISTAVVWAVYSSGITGSNGALEAFAANPGGTCTAAAPCTISPIWSAPIGTASQFTTVATAGGMVYVGTRDGAVYGFGDTAGAALAPAAPAALPATPVGSASASRDVTVTARSDVTVTGVTAGTAAAGGSTSQFRLGPVTETTPGGSAAPVSFPVTLRRGDRLTAPVSFHPAAPGGVTGAVSFATSSGAPGRVPLTADGTTRGLYLTPSPEQFALVTDTGAFASNVPVGVIVPREIDLVNGSTHAETVRSVRAPGVPYSVTGLPAVGTVLRPGQSVVIQVVFGPARPGPAPGTLAVTGSSGGTATAQLTGTGLPARGLFRATPAAVGFGTVPAGTTAHSTITLANTGNEPATVDRVSTLHAPFAARPSVPPGLPINAGYDVLVPVRFTPHRPGRFTARYTFTWTDVTGTHTITVHVSGTATSG